MQNLALAMEIELIAFALEKGIPILGRNPLDILKDIAQSLKKEEKPATRRGRRKKAETETVA